VKRAVVLAALVAVAAVAGAIVYRSTVRERSYRLLIASGEAALAAGQTLEAVEDFSGAIAVRPDAMLPRLRRGETYRRLGEFEVAARDFRQASQLDPTATRPLEELADVLYSQERFRRAAETYEARLRLDDRSALVRYKLALARYRDGAVAPALDEARRAAAMDGRMAEARHLMAVCLRELGQIDAAVAALEEAAALAPALIPIREELADLYATLGRTREQVQQLQTLAALDRSSARLVALALAQANAGQPDLAVLMLTGGLQTSQDQPQLYAAIGRIWLDLAERQDSRTDALPNALEALARAASAPTAPSDVRASYGRALARAGQYDAAEEVFQQAIERFPVDPSALLQYAAVAERLGHAGAARSALTDYAALNPSEVESPEYALRVGSLSLAANDATGALPWLERAAAATPDDVRALAMLADARLRTGDPAGAQVVLTHALALAPGDAHLRALTRRIGRTAP
jgi:tetratricopeptide (TPR) repeat protein